MCPIVLELLAREKMVDLLVSYNLIDWKQLRADRINLNSLWGLQFGFNVLNKKCQH